jgi:uncharacterized protein YbjT (DUF2867 family)
MQGLRVIITGSTGMVGEGVLLVCLNNPQVEKILIINRRTLGINHPKLTEIIHSDFCDISAIENQLSGYNACYFCLGVSSVGINKEDYYKTTYTLTMHVAEALSKLNPDMTFCYVSGAGTDSSEEGRLNWARVKGKTENDLMKLPFKQVFAYRPGFMKPIKGQKNVNRYYKYVNWMFPIGRKFFQNGFNTLQEVGLSMIEVTLAGYTKKVIEGKDISLLAKAIIEK